MLQQHRARDHLPGVPHQELKQHRPSRPFSDTLTACASLVSPCAMYSAVSRSSLNQQDLHDDTSDRGTADGRHPAVELPIANIAPTAHKLQCGMVAGMSQTTVRRVSNRARLFAARCVCLLVPLTGCATYQALPLDTSPPLSRSLEQLQHPGSALRMPLGMGEVAYLAVQNNPDLRAARARRGVVEAQVLTAGLLPNPQVTGSYMPVLAGPGIIPAWTAGLTG
ncbi:MAG: hypothetical protein M3Y41_09540, partial [Pseudomonadota bacterium]|nr:hypothetical protein [Pseudomonadota bacterium]